MKTKSLLLLGALTVSLWSCEENDTVCSCQDPTPCDQLAKSDNGLYENGPADQHFINEAAIEGDCLYLTFQYGGGCESIDYQLLSNDNILYAQPPQRSIRLALDEDDPCEALPQVEASFNLEPLQLENTDTLILKLEGWEEDLAYVY